MESKNILTQGSQCDFALLFNLSQDMLCMADEEGTILKVNQKFSEITGFNETELPCTSLNYLLHPEDYHRVLNLINLAHLNVDLKFETSFLCSDNTYKAVNCSAVKNQHAQTFISARLSNDIFIYNPISTNELKILDFSLDVICVVDAEGNFSQMNKASLNLFGYEPAELLGKKFTEFIHPDDLEYTHGIAQVMKSGESLNDFENRYIRKDGSVVSVLWTANWIEEDQTFYCVAREATGRKIQEEATALNERRFQALVQSSSDLLGIISAKGEYKYVSPTVSHILGHDSTYYLGKNVFLFIHPDDQEYLSTILETITGHYKLELQPYRFSDSNGKWHWLQTVVTNLLNDPAVNGIVVNSKDITLRKEIENEMLQNSRRLNNLIDQNKDGSFTLSRDWRFTSFNLAAQNTLTQLEGIVIGANIWEVLPNGKNLKFFKEFNRAFEQNVVVHFEEFSPAFNRWFDVNAFPYEDFLTVFIRDITKSKIQNLTLTLEKEVLEMNATSVCSLKQLTDHLLSGFEKIHYGLKVSLLVVDKDSNKLYPLSIPSIPDFLKLTSDGIEIGPGKGPCSMAAFKGAEIDVRDILTDNMVVDFRDLLKQYSINSCRSFPIINKNKEVLAVISIFNSGHKLALKVADSMNQRLGTIVQLLLENQQAKTDIELRNERYKLTIQATSDSIWDLDLEKNQLYRGNGFGKYHDQEAGFEPLDLRKWELNIHPEDAQRVERSLEKALDEKTTPKWTEEYRYLKKDGTYAVVIDKVYIVRNNENKAIRIVGAMQDITDIRKNQEKLLQSEENYKLLFSQNPTPMSTYDLEMGKFFMVNDAALNLFGYTREEFLALDLYSMRVKEEHSRLKKWLASPLFYGEGTLSAEWKYLKKDQSVIIAEVTSNFIEINGRKSRLISIKDITDQKKARIKIIDQNKRLREIAQISSHEFRKPVASILGLVQLFDKENPNSKFNSEIINYLDITAHQLDVIIHTIVKKTWKEEN